MLLLNLKKSLCLLVLLTLPVSTITVTAIPGWAAAKGKGKKPAAHNSKVKGTINFAPQEAPPFNIEGVRENLEGRLSVAWRPNAVGSTNYCEIHFVLWPDGSYTGISVWRSSGKPSYDQAAKTCIDQGSYAPYIGPEMIECIATFKTEDKGADVTIRFPAYQGTSSKVDRVIAAKHAADIANIKIMLQRISAAQKVLGPDSPKLSQSINFLANLYTTVEDYSSAEAAFKWAARIREKANGPSSRELCETLSDMGEMYRHRGDEVSSEECFKRCVSMDLKPCVQQREAIHRYAVLCMYNKRKADADFLFQRVNDLQAGKDLAPLPANMIYEGAAKSPDAAGAGGAKAGGDKPSDAAKPDAAKPDGTKSDAGKSEAIKSDAGKTDAGKSGQSPSAAPTSGAPASGTPGSNTPASGAAVPTKAGEQSHGNQPKDGK